ncbi:hypothetical protein JXA70_20335 [candidate division KSB1 bacterium]|nr:hypothetical protein [candidate division KSB1 bacterium]
MLNPIEIGSIIGPELSKDLKCDATFDIATGSFDGDEIDEIIIAMTYIIDITQAISVKLYDCVVDIQFQFAKDTTVYINPDPGPNNYSHLERISIATGNFDPGPFDEVALGNSIQARLNASYGEGFSRDVTTTHTTIVGFDINTIKDDQIFGTTLDYDIWEYPVYAKGQTMPSANILIVNPKVARETWFASKSSDASSYVPCHKVGNILSYQNYDDLKQNAAVKHLIKGQSGASIQVNESSSKNWEVMERCSKCDGSSSLGYWPRSGCIPRISSVGLRSRCFRLL